MVTIFADCMAQRKAVFLQRRHYAVYLQAAPRGLAASAAKAAVVVVVAVVVGHAPERPVVRGLEEHGDDRLHLEYLRRLLHDQVVVPWRAAFDKRAVHR